MAKTTGLGDQLFVDGNNLSGDAGSIQKIGGGPAPLDVTSIDKSGFERLGGKRDGGIGFTSWFNPTGAHPVLKTLPTTDRIVTYLRGSALGAPAASCVGKQIGYDPTRSEDGSLSLVVDVQADGFGVEWGDAMTPGLRTDTTPTNGASVDFLAASTFGFQAYLQVLSVVGTSVTVTLQESSDNGGADPFANVVGGSFTAVTPGTAPQAQRIAASPANLERYLRVVTTGTFTSAAFVVMVVRNLTATVF